MSTSVSSKNSLDAGGAIGEAPAFGGFQIDGLIGIARRSEQLHEPRRIGTLRGGVEFEVIEIERKRAVRRAADQTADLIDHGRAAVAGEPHHFVLAFVHREAEVGGERRVQHAERMRKSDFARKIDAGRSARDAVRRGRRTASPTRRRHRWSRSPRDAWAR